MTDFGRRPAVAAANVLPKTGQTTSYPVGDDTDRDDGYYQAGWEGERFTDNGDGTITDNATSLMWPKDAEDPLLDMQLRTWVDQIAHIEGLTFAGYSDWRMANVVEVQSLIDWSVDYYDITTQMLNARETHWATSTTYKGDDTYIFYFSKSTIGMDLDGKEWTIMSLCVRSVE